MTIKDDLKPFKHGEEGTHYACNERMAEGCCGCENHKCKTSKPETWEDRFEILTPDSSELELDYNGEKNWLKNNEHLFTGNMYDEPAFTLDKEKIKSFITQELALQRKEMEENEKLNNEYQQLLIDELNEVVPLAAAHGWVSSRVEEGKRLRKLLNKN